MFIYAQNILKKLKAFFHKKYDYVGYWSVELQKRTKFKIGDHIIGEFENYRTSTKHTVQYEIVGFEIDPRCNERIEVKLVNSYYILKDLKKYGLKEEIISEVDNEYQIDTITTTTNQFNTDLGALLK